MWSESSGWSPPESGFTADGVQKSLNLSELPRGKKTKCGNTCKRLTQGACPPGARVLGSHDCSLGSFFCGKFYVWVSGL